MAFKTGAIHKLGANLTAKPYREKFYDTTRSSNVVFDDQQIP